MQYRNISFEKDFSRVLRTTVTTFDETYKYMRCSAIDRANCDHRKEDPSICHRHVNGILFQMAWKMGDIECCMIVSSSLQTKSHAIKVASDWQSFCIKFLCRLD